MSKIIRIAIDLSKEAFQLHGVNGEDEVILSRQLHRGQVLGFFAKQAPSLVGMEARASAHYWARELMALVPPAYVKPYVKRGRKNDANDAAALCEAMARRAVARVPVKPPEQQAVMMLHRARKVPSQHSTTSRQELLGHPRPWGGCRRQAGLAVQSELIQPTTALRLRGR